MFLLSVCAGNKKLWFTLERPSPARIAAKPTRTATHGGRGGWKGTS